MDEKDKKEKVSSLQVLICAGPSKSGQAGLLPKKTVQKSKQGRQSKKMAEQTGKQRLFQGTGTC